MQAINKNSLFQNTNIDEIYKNTCEWYYNANWHKEQWKE